MEELRSKKKQIEELEKKRMEDYVRNLNTVKHAFETKEQNQKTGYNFKYNIKTNVSDLSMIEPLEAIYYLLTNMNNRLNILEQRSDLVSEGAGRPADQ